MGRQGRGLLQAGFSEPFAGVLFELKPEYKDTAGAEMWGRKMSGRGQGECKDPEVGEDLAGSTDREVATMFGE